MAYGTGSLGVVKDAAGTWLLLDGGAYGFDPTVTFAPSMIWYIPGATVNRANVSSISGSARADALDGRHPNHQINVCFVAGHVASMPADTVCNTWSMWFP